MSNLFKIRPVGVELFHPDGRTDRQTHDEASSRFSQYYERAQKNSSEYREVFETLLK